MTSEPSVAHRFATAFNSRDVDRVCDVFTSDATYDDLFYGRFTGHAGLARLFTRMYTEGDWHEWTMTNVVRNESCTIGEWQFAFTISGAVPHGSGRTLSFTGVSVFVTRGDRCRAYREQFDRTAALVAAGIQPSTVARMVSRRSTVRVLGPAG